MAAVVTPERKRPVNVTLSEALVAQAKAHTGNLCATIEVLLQGIVMEKQALLNNRQPAADACAEGWNSMHAAVGSFADEHNTL